MGCGASSPEPTSGGYANSNQQGYPTGNYGKPQASVHPVQHYSQPQAQHNQPATAPHAQPNAQAPQQPNSSPKEKVVYNDAQTEIPVRDIETTKDLLQKYIDIENEVIALEKKTGKVRQNDAKAELAAMNEKMAELEKSLEKAKEKEANLTQMENQDAEIAKAEVEGERGLIEKELQSLKAEKATREQQYQQHSQKNEELENKYKEQDELLAAIFKGKYGSYEENKLEAEYDFLADKLHRVSAARYKWTNGRNLLQYSTAQLCVSCKKWMELLRTNPGPQSHAIRYTLATESRNHSIAAAQNISAAGRYLRTIAFPYCKPEEVRVLETAAAHVYTDMNNSQRHQYVYVNVYLSMYKRCKALVDWFTYVLEETIAKDLKEATKLANAKAVELRQERLNLIAVKIKEELHQDVTLEAREEQIVEDDISIADDLAPVAQAEGGAGDGTSEDEPPPEGDIEAEQPFNPVPLKELVQTPNKEDLFGDAQELYRKHQENLEELEKNQMINKARQEQGLEEKLRARRSRRQRQAAINAELQMETDTTE